MLPAVVEASQTNTPLVLLTADRPIELLDAGANQTIDQVKIFGNYARWSVDLDAPNDLVPARVALTTMDTAFRAATGGVATCGMGGVEGVPSGRPGPVHINCRFRDPLVPQTREWNRQGVLQGLDRWAESGEPYTTGTVLFPEAASPWNIHPALLQRLVGANTRGLLVVGQLGRGEDVAAAVAIASALQWPVAADVLSGVYIGGNCLAMFWCCVFWCSVINHVVSVCFVSVCFIPQHYAHPSASPHPISPQACVWVQSPPPQTPHPSTQQSTTIMHMYWTTLTKFFLLTSPIGRLLCLMCVCVLVHM